MKPEKQRITIAKACGWTCIQMGPSGYFIGVILEPEVFRPLPDYLNDLNAMHEAEKRFLYSTKMTDAYVSSLTIYCKCNPWRATAGQRAESFLKTLGLWEDDNL